MKLEACAPYFPDFLATSVMTITQEPLAKDLLLRSEEGQIHGSPSFWGTSGSCIRAVVDERGSSVLAGTLQVRQQQRQTGQRKHLWILAVTGKGAMTDIYTLVMNFPVTNSHSQTTSVPQQLAFKKKKSVKYSTTYVCFFYLGREGMPKVWGRLLDVCESQSHCGVLMRVGLCSSDLHVILLPSMGVQWDSSLQILDLKAM